MVRNEFNLHPKSVTILNRRREEDMAALKSEIEAARNEGIVIRTLLGPVKVTGENKVTGLTCCVREYKDELDKVVDTAEQLHLPARFRGFSTDTSQR